MDCSKCNDCLYCRKWRERRICRKGKKGLPISELDSCPAGFFATKEQEREFEKNGKVDDEKIISRLLWSQTSQFQKYEKKFGVSLIMGNYKQKERILYGGYRFA